MDLFGIKKRKIEKEKARQKALEDKLNEEKDKAIEAKIAVKRALNSMKAQSTKYEKLKVEYIEKARKAALENNAESCKLAKHGLKICLSQQRVIDTMIANVEIALQMNETNSLIAEFVKSVNTISTELNCITPSVDITNAQAELQKSISQNEKQMMTLDNFFENASSGYETYGQNISNVSDEEIDSLITNQVIDSESELDTEIDEKINSIRSQINNN